MKITAVLSCFIALLSTFLSQPETKGRRPPASGPRAVLIPTKKFLFNSFVDCNMAEAWVGDTFRIFPGKYGEDPLWGNSRELKYADGRHADEAFGRRSEEFTEPRMPKNAPAGKPGLHGAVWFETVYQDTRDQTGKTLFAVYHNENYPSTLPYDAQTRKGYKNEKWPEGLRGPTSPAAVCRIGIMKSVDGGRSWANRGLFLEDDQPRLILKPHNTSKTFAGGVGDPSAVASGGYLYLFYGEYGYPGTYDPARYHPDRERSGQCISVARIRLGDLDNPAGKARRWDGTGFNAPSDGVGTPIAALQLSPAAGGGPASLPKGGFRWGPSVSWNTYLKAWVMLMGHVEGPSWQGGKVYISFNPHADLGAGQHSQAWSKPELLVNRPGHTLWYPSLQPLNSPDDVDNRHTCLKLGRRARLFFKDIQGPKSEYLSEYIVEFQRP